MILPGSLTPAGGGGPSTGTDSLRAAHESKAAAGDHRAAIGLAEREVAERRGLGATDELAAALHSLGGYLVTASEYARARSVLEESLALRRRLNGPDDPRILNSLWLLIDALQKSGDFASAERASNEALVLVRKIPDNDAGRVFGTYSVLSARLRAVGEVQEAIDIVTEGLARLAQGSGLSEHRIRLRSMLALLYNDQLRYVESVTIMEQNDRECRLLYPDDSLLSLFTTINLALTRGFMRQFDLAERLLSEATTRARVMERRGVNVTHALHTIDSYRGRTANWSGRFEEAEACLKLSLAYILGRNYPRGHEQVVKVLLWLGESRAGRGDLAGAEAYFDSAVAGYEEARRQIGSGIRPATFQKTPYEYRALCRIERGRSEAAWQDLERARGRLLSDSLIDESTRPSMASVRSSLASDEAIVGWIDLELPEGTPHAFGYVLRATGPVRWVRLPVDPVERVFTRAARYVAFRQAIVDAGYSAIGGNTFAAAEARQIWTERFAPLIPQLGGVRTLIVIPSDAMATLPLDALIDEDGAYAGDRFAIIQAPSASIYAWLCGRSRGLEPVPRSGLLLGDPPFREEHLAAWAPPEGPQARPLPSPVQAATLRGAVRHEPEALGDLPRLPWSRREVMSIAPLFPEATTLLGAEASRESLGQLHARGAMQRFDVLHFATHAVVDDLRPESSVLVLSQLAPAQAPADDGAGVVTATEIDGWRLNAELVTLSACETALGRNVFGEGTIGFAYPLLRAGSRCLLASRWPVNDEATALFMKSFYSNWIGAPGTPRSTKAQALRAARKWLRTWRDERGKQPYAHPYYWASFVLVGR